MYRTSQSADGLGMLVFRAACPADGSDRGRQAESDVGLTYLYTYCWLYRDGCGCDTPMPFSGGLDISTSPPRPRAPRPLKASAENGGEGAVRKLRLCVGGDVFFGVD